MADEQQEPQLHIDSDWKAQAQAEKQRLAEEEQKRAAERGEAGGQPGKLPEPDFKALVSILAFQAMQGLGMYGDQKSGRVIVDPDGAKFNIDLLEVLQEKTEGNLSDEESKELAQVLSELRSRFVQIMELVAKQGAVPGGGDAGGGGTAGPQGGPTSNQPGSPSQLHMP